MAREKATTKSTGGGGFTFADKVAAAFLARMLRRDSGLVADVGPISDIDFETRESGNLLDDLEITFRREQQATRLLLSIKSNRQLTKAGFNSEFVADAWEQWQGAHARRPFDPGHDLLGLAVQTIDDQALDEWKIIHQQAIDTNPQRFLDRLVPEGQSNSTQRAIFESLRATETEAKRDALETARLAGRIRVIPFSDKDQNEAINLCTEIVADGSLPEARNLWGRLLQIAAESRGTGAHLDLPIVVRKLRPDFDLRDYPDFQADWHKLEAISKENIENEVRTSLGAGIHLPRTGTQAHVAAEIEKNNVTVLTGESGSGKSSLISEIAKPGGKYRRTVWLTAGQLSKPSQIETAKTLNLRHALPELIAGSAVGDSVLVVDGFEQFAGDARKSIVRLTKELHEQDFENWKVIVTCQSQTLDAVRDALLESGVTSFGQVDFEKPKLEEVLAGVQNVSALRPLLMRKELQPILRNLMILDWVIREEVAHRIPASQSWIGETEIIDLIWDRWIGSDSKKFARDRLLRLLGQEEGERLTGAVHIDSLPRDQLELLGELVQKGLLRINGGSVRFYHDLMGDWARYRSLRLAGTDAAARIRDRVKAPRWGRAIRLYAQSLAEEGKGLERWRALAAELSGEDPDSKLAGDFLLDALLFAPNAEALLEQVWSDLIADKAETLKRLLQRLLHVASIPDWRFQGLEDTKLAERSEAWFRIPHPLYWYPVLRVLSRHRQDIVELAPGLGAEVSALWLRTMPSETFGRDEASRLAVDIAKRTQGFIAAGRHLDDKSQVVFEALLYAAPDCLDEVQQISLELSGRRPEPSYAVDWAMEDQERQDRWLEEWKQKHPEENSGRRVRVPGTTS